MKALTLTQPWASLVASGAKKIETRGWATSYRGPLAIHAAKTLNRETYPDGDHDFVALCNTEPFRSALVDAGWAHAVFDDLVPTPMALPRAAIVAVVVVDRCTEMTEKGIAELAHLHPREHAFGFYEPGRYAWVLRDLHTLPAPVECRGGQKLWDVPTDVAERINPQREE